MLASDIASELDLGSLSARLVSGLTGVPQGRLDGWHRRGVVRARICDRPQSGPRTYTWRQYCQVRAAAKLLNSGVAPRRLRGELAAIDATVAGWPALALREHRTRGVAQCASGSGGTPYSVAGNGDGRPPVLFACGDDATEDACAARLKIVGELQAEGPLAGLAEYSQWIDMRPSVQAGWPTIIGTRITTETIAEYAAPGMSVAEIAETLWLDRLLVEKALAFHASLGIPLG